MRTLFDPTELAGMRLRNRLFRSATWLGLCEPDGTMRDEVFQIYEELAEGGVAAIVTELTDVCARNSAKGDNMRLYSDALVPDARRLVEIAHAHGAAIIPQLNMDLYVRPGESGEAVDVSSMSGADISDAERLYVEAAVRAAGCSFDAVQLHLAYGWLLHRFLDPAQNRRMDRYGGSDANRARIVREIVEGIKAAVPGMPVCAKFSFYRDAGGGFAVDSCAEICRILYEGGLDFVEVLGIHTRAETGMREPSRHRDLAVAVRNRCDIPVVLTGANVDPDAMETILNEDGVEYFGISRPLIREPGLPERWRRGDRGRAECVGCNACYRTEGKRCIFSDRKARP